MLDAIPNPTGTRGSYLYGVSCTLARACTAVGYYISHSGKAVTLAEAWNGSTWRIQPTPNPPGATASYLYGVSCTSSKACTAVGYYASSVEDVTLAEAWNGSAWRIQRTPNPASTAIYLNGVSCTSSKACTAVGYYQSITGPFVTVAEAWNGSAWKVQTTPKPAGAKGSYLDGVSCTSTKACTAVGYYRSRVGKALTLVEAWNGSAWRIRPTPNPAGATSDILSGVSCFSSNACTVVGSNDSSSGEVTLAEAWNGRSWRIQPTPNHTGAAGSGLGAVSCTSSKACTAVGTYSPTGSSALTSAAAWNGSAWKIQITPNPTGVKQGYGFTGSHLDEVSCTTSIACSAVGYYLSRSGKEVMLVESKGG